MFVSLTPVWSCLGSGLWCSERVQSWQTRTRTIHFSLFKFNWLSFLFFQFLQVQFNVEMLLRSPPILFRGVCPRPSARLSCVASRLRLIEMSKGAEFSCYAASRSVRRSVGRWRGFKLISLLTPPSPTPEGNFLEAKAALYFWSGTTIFLKWY